MSNLDFAPGDYRVGVILAVPVMTDYAGIVVHKGILADQRGGDGWPTVLHKSKHFGKALETSMTDFSSRRVGPIRSDGFPSRLASWQVLQRARQQSNQPWSLTDNCEHYVSRSHGLAPNSPQLQAGLAKTAVATGLGVVLVAILGGARGS
jgi:hypothetical protein